MVAVLLGFCKVPLEWRNCFATFFFLACSSARIFFYFICAACNFFLPTRACRKFFFEIIHPPPSRVKWSAPNDRCAGAYSYITYSRLVKQAKLFVAENMFHVTWGTTSQVFKSLSVNCGLELFRCIINSRKVRTTLYFIITSTIVKCCTDTLLLICW